MTHGVLAGYEMVDIKGTERPIQDTDTAVDIAIRGNQVGEGSRRSALMFQSVSEKRDYRKLRGVVTRSLCLVSTNAKSPLRSLCSVVWCRPL